MNSSTRSSLILCTASFLGGIGLGNLQRAAHPPGEAAEKAVSPEAGAQPAGLAVRARDSSLEESSSALEAEASAFLQLSLEEQTASLLRLSKRAGESPSLRLLLAKLAARIPADSLARILAALEERETAENLHAKTLVAERLAAIDPRRALALGVEKKDRSVAWEGFGGLLKENAAEALKAWAELPNELRADFSAGKGGLVSPGGSLGDVLAAVKSQPALIEGVAARNGSGRLVVEIIGMLSAKAAMADTVQALSEMRAAADEIINANPKRDPRMPEIERIKLRDALVAKIADQALRALRNESMPLGSGFFNALKDSEKNWFGYSTEAVARYKHAGSETAVSFAESQNSKDNMSAASTGVWWALACENQTAALQWIESIPPGAFRDGCLQSVMMHAWTHSQSWGDPQVAIEAGAKLLSRASRLDYYSTLMTDRHFGNGDGRSRADFIAGLPLSPEDKLEIERRTAPANSR